ncbi:hypothetical protein D3C83_215170 [compost metagenome]
MFDASGNKKEISGFETAGFTARNKCPMAGDDNIYFIAFMWCLIVLFDRLVHFN